MVYEQTAATMEVLLRSLYGATAVMAVMAVPHATPLRIGQTRGCFEHVQSFRLAIANDSKFPPCHRERSRF